MNKAILLALLMLAMPLALATPEASTTANIQITTAETAQDFIAAIKDKVIDPQRTCYVYTPKHSLIHSYSVGAPPSIEGDVTNYKSYNIQDFHDIYTFRKFVTENCYETAIINIKGKDIIGYNDLGRCDKTKEQINTALATPEAAICIADLPVTKSYVSGASPSKGTVYLSLMGLSKSPYGRTDYISAGFKAGNKYSALQFTITCLSNCGGYGGYYITANTPNTKTIGEVEIAAYDKDNNLLISGSGNLQDLGLTVNNGKIQTMNLADLPDSAYNIVRGETYQITLEGKNKKGKTLKTTTKTITFTNEPVPP